MCWTVSIPTLPWPFCQPRPLQPSGPPPGNVKHRAGLKPGLGHRDPEKLYRPPDHLRRIYSPFFPHVSFVHGAPGVRGADPETGLGLDPFDVHL